MAESDTVRPVDTTTDAPTTETGDLMPWTPPPNWPAPPTAGWTPPQGWQPDPAWGPAPAGWVFYPDGDAPGARASTTRTVDYRGPARAAHGGGYWLWVGWWWEPVKWLGRMSLWVVFFPLGLWRSLRHGRKNREARERRGYST